MNDSKEWEGKEITSQCGRKLHRGEESLHAGGGKHRYRGRDLYKRGGDTRPFQETLVLERRENPG